MFTPFLHEQLFTINRISLTQTNQQTLCVGVEITLLQLEQNAHTVLRELFGGKSLCFDVENVFLL